MYKKYLLGISAGLLVASFALALTTSSIVPTADGNYTAWTPSTGTSHFALVDETTCNGTTDYNSTATVGNRDSYTTSLSSVPNGSLITAIGITPCASRNSNGGGSSTLNVFYRLNGVNSSDSGAYALTGTTPAGLAQTNFAGLSVLKTSTTTLESGAIYSAGTKGARLSRIGTVITYTSLSTTSLSASTISNSQINLSWSDTNTIEDGYLVERSSVATSGPFTQIATTSVNAVSYNDTGLSGNTKYWYRVKSFNYGGESSYSNVASSTTLANPPTVTTNTATSVATSSATLNGSANPNGATATGWFRYSSTTQATCDDTFGVRSPSSGGTALGSGSVDVNYSSNLTGLLDNTTYYYCAISSNSGGNGYGSVQTFTTNQTILAPSSLSASTISNSQINLSWSDTNTIEDGYLVERSSVATSGPFTQIATTSVNAVSYNDTGLSGNTKYWYRVRAYNSTQYSTYSSTVSTTTQPNLSVPTSLNSTAVSNSQINLTWNDTNSLEDGYLVERSSTSLSGPFTNISTTSVNANSYNDTGLSTNTKYWYRVRAYNSTQYSGYSSVASTTTFADIPVVTTDLASSVGTTSATLNGSANPNGATATGWFRYSSTTQATCDDTFGVRSPSFGGTNLGSGTSTMAYSSNLTALLTSSTYYYCAISSNSGGKGYGSIQTFTTLP